MLHEPLANRIRPTTIEEVIGQSHLLGEDKPLYKMIKNNQLSSLILHGPPGIGKTTIASAIAGSCGLPFEQLNAVSAGKKDLEKVTKEYKEEDTSVVLYVDEIHRFTKNQVEYLLPYVESGKIILVGSTTESVYHALPSAILSRCTVFELKPLTSEEIVLGLSRALQDKDGLVEYMITWDDSLLERIAQLSGGDMRSALNILEVLVVTNADTETKQTVNLTLEMVDSVSGTKNLGYNGKDTLYDLMSAFQKSIRGSDVNAALYYLALLIESGDLPSICRRLLVIADEDIGLARPEVATHVLTAVQITERIGLPEARITLSKAVIELCLSPKSNTAYQAIDNALADIRNGQAYSPPDHLKDAHYKSAADRGHGVGYLYPHNYELQDYGGWCNQQYLPDKLRGRLYYRPKNNGYERGISSIYWGLEQLKSNQ
ncbi:recombination protein RarA [Bacillus phage SP-15]|uniref:Recombination protein RarA n=1 Tax=Bacillus phage SP-15 TaxID=1792032 RepID=A0A127AWE7_9CAUD|nr:clamp loader of DNA polymerase [Bacillus phage SP-15]AMM45019.1 recombination protein RarA [Bacillus phage SP-15]